MKKNVILFCILSIFALSFAEKAVVRIENPSRHLLKHYMNSGDIAAYKPNLYLDVVVSIEEAESLSKSNNNIYITQTEKQLSNNLKSKDLAGYRNYDELLTELQDLADTYPEICQLVDLGDSRGKEYSEAGIGYYDDFNHEVWGLKISDNVAEDEDEPAIYWMGEHHAREPISLEVVMYATNHVLENYGTDSEITDNIDNSVLWVVPLVNPNGHKIVTDETDVWWRKNIRDNNENQMFDTDYDGGYGNDGVDPNRNYGYAWGEVGTSSNPSSVLYHGPIEFSEPETMAMKSLMENYHFVAGSSYHSYSELVLFPYGYANNIYAPDHAAMEQLAIDMAVTIPAAGGGHYDPTESWTLYPAMGTTDDFAYGQHGIFAYTIELGTEFIPPANEVAGICEDNLEAALIMLDRPSHSMLTGHITDSETGEIVVAEVFITGIDDSTVEREPYNSNEDFGRYYRLLVPGNYDITFSAYGYDNQTISNVNITDQNVTELDIQMSTASVQYTVNGSVYNTGYDYEMAVENCTIEFLNANIANATTDQDGYFTIPNLYEYEYDILLYAAGYEARYYTMNVSASETAFTFNLANFDQGDFEENEVGFYWDFSGNSWILDSGNNSSYSMKTYNIGDQDGTTAEFSINVAEADEISFDKKVSTEYDYDFFRFYIDGNAMGSWSGEVDWSSETYPVEPGVHTFMWSYTKDQAVSDGSDCAWIDNIIFPAGVGLDSEEQELTSTLIRDLGNYPNPFNPTTNISFSVSDNLDKAQLSVYNIKGQLVKTLLNSSIESGIHNITWDGKDSNSKTVSSGIYFYKLSTGKTTISKKMMLIK